MNRRKTHELRRKSRAKKAGFGYGQMGRIEIDAQQVKGAQKPPLSDYKNENETNSSHLKL
jgi:hypothetical protein